MRAPTLVALLVIGIAVAHAAYLSLFGFGFCQVEANDPGEPANPQSCRTEVSPPALVITLLMAVAGAGVFLASPGLAWPPAVMAVGIALLFGFGVGGALLPHVGVTLLSVAAWHLVARPRRRLETPPPSG